jgi:uncharacterized protein YjiS (DUF1127 family)
MEPAMTSNAKNTFPTHRLFSWDQVKRRIAEWQRRSLSRNELEGLSDATLRDIGISRCDAHREIRKPFWMA